MKPIVATEAVVRISLRNGHLHAMVLTNHATAPGEYFAGAGLGHVSPDQSWPSERTEHEQWMRMFDRWSLIENSYRLAEILGVGVELRSDGGTCERPLPVEDRVAA